MISIIQHSLKGSELVARRFGAMRTHLDPETLEAFQVDDVGRRIEAGDEIFPRASAHSGAQVLLSGVVGEVMRLNGGRRQIVAVRLPGEVLLASEGEALVAMTRTRLADGASLIGCLASRSENYQLLRRAWVASARLDQAILRDQVVRLGRMSAVERTVHFLLESHERLAHVGLAADTNFNLPLTQEMLSDVVGLSVVHLNRTLQSLRRGNLIAVRSGYITFVDRPRLISIAGYVSRFPVPWRPRAVRDAPCLAAVR